VIVYSITWPIAINISTGFKTVNPTIMMVGRNLGLGGWRMVKDVLMAASLPHIISGLRTGWAFGWRTIVAAELVFGVAGKGGLVFFINDARYFLRIPEVFAGIATIALIEIIVETIFNVTSPDSYQALLNGQIAGHFTAAPYQFQEQDEGARPIVRSFDLFGRHNLISIWALQPFHDENPQAMEALYSNFRRATELINDDPGRVAWILAGVSQIDPADEERFLTEENVYFNTAPHGFVSFEEFMQSAGLIEDVPGSWKDLVYPNLKTADGS